MSHKVWKWMGLVCLGLGTVLAAYACDEPEKRVITVRESTSEAPDRDPETKSEAEYEMVAPGEMVVDD